MFLVIIPFVSPLLLSGSVIGGQRSHPAPIDSETPVVDVAKHETWKEGSGGRSHHVMRCGSFTVSLSVARDAEGISVESLSLNDKPVGADIRSEIENAASDFRGFDYPYVLCTSKQALLAFNHHPRKGEVRSFAVELN